MPPLPEAPPIEPETEPESLPDDEPSRRDEPSPFDPYWPDDLPVPPPKAVAVKPIGRSANSDRPSHA